MALQPIPTFPKEFQDQVNKACKYYSKPHKSDEIAKLPLASIALEAELLRKPSHLTDNDGRAKALKQIIQLSLEDLKPKERNSREWDLYLCLYSHILEKDPSDGQSFVNKVKFHINEKYAISPSSYNRYKKRGLEYLSPQISKRLAQQVMWREAVPQIRGVVEREEFSYYREELKSEGLAVIEGVAGVGKTILGAQLANEFRTQRRAVCWQTIHLGINDSTLGVLYGWAAFLAQHDYTTLWMLIRTVAPNINTEAKQKGVTLPTLLSSLREGLAKVRPLLCLDNLEIVAKDNKQFWSLLEVVQLEPNTGLLLISEQRPPFPRLGDYQKLGGFSPNEVTDFLSRRNIYLTTEQLDMVMYHTLGNAGLLDLWVTNIKLQEVDLSTSLAKLRHSEATTYLLNDILQSLTPSQKRAASLLALSRKPLDSFLLQEQPEELPPLRELGISADDFTTLSESGLLHNLLGDQCTLLPPLKEQLKVQLMPKEGLPSDEAIAYHRWLAEWWRLQGNIWEAVYHEMEQQNEEEAVCQLAKHKAILIEQRYAFSMSEALANIQVEHLSPPVRQLRRKVQTELLQFVGDYDAAEAEIEATKHEATTAIARAESEQAAGELAKRRGNFPQASDAYQQALRLLAPSQLTLEANLHRNLAWSLMKEGKLDKAWNEAQRTRIALENTLGVIARLRSEMAQAEEHYKRGIAIAEEYGLKRELRPVYSNLAALYRQQKKYEQAMGFHRKNLALFEQVDHLAGKAVTLMGMGNCYLDMGDQEAAIRHYLDAMSTFTTLGDRNGQLLTQINLARGYLHVGQLDMAFQHAEAAIKMDKTQADPTAWGEAQRVYAEVLFAQNKPLDALTMAQEALESHRVPRSPNKYHDIRYAKLACQTLVRIHRALDQSEEAEKYARLAEELMGEG